MKYIIIVALALITLWITPYLWTEFFKGSIYEIPFVVTLIALFSSYVMAATYLISKN